MHDDDRSEQERKQLLDMQAALFSLRDGLLNLSMSLRELAFLTDEDGRRRAHAKADELISRLRG